MNLSIELPLAAGRLATLTVNKLNLSTEHPLIKRQVYLQNRQTLLYLASEGQWVPNRSEALVLETFEDAYDHANHNMLEGLQIVITCGIDSKEFALPLR